MDHKDTIETIKQFYLDKLNNEIYYIDNFIQTGKTIKKELLNSYESLMIKDNAVDIPLKVNPCKIVDLCDAVIEEHEQIRLIQKQVKDEYIQSLIENILHREIKKELKKAIINIEKIDLSPTISFFNLAGESIIRENIKDINKSIEEVICNVITKELKLK